MLMDIIVIGGGPAGLIAALAASKNGASVAIIEKNKKPGQKILITGKGRCNITNDCDIDTLINNVKTNKKFLYSAFNLFSARDIINTLNENGLKTKTERGSRVFPVTDKASDVRDTLVAITLKAGVSIINDKVNNIYKNEDAWQIACDNNKYTAKKIIIATGGLSYPKTGSTGDGYNFAKKLNHTIIKPQASLIPIVTKEKFVKNMMGLSLKNVKLSLCKSTGKKPIYSNLGEMIFTHFGISGPLVLSASAYIKREEIDDYTLEIDWKPALSHDEIDNRIKKDFKKYSNKSFKNSLNDLLPKKAIDTFISLSNIEADKKVNQITKDERKNLATLFKKMQLTPIDFRPISEAIVTSGGVSVKEIDSKTMQSRLHEGLYFAGEIIDVDAFTGGFNLQIAYSTGYTAGFFAAKALSNFM